VVTVVTSQRFTVNKSVILDAAGGGQVDIYPSGGDWVVVHQSLQVSTNVKEPTAKVYKGGVSPAGFVEGSYSGSNDASDTRVVLQSSNSLSCVWTGGDAGARATYYVTVVQYPAGQAPAE
jgi:hypothetical protein